MTLVSTPTDFTRFCPILYGYIALKNRYLLENIKGHSPEAPQKLMKYRLLLSFHDERLRSCWGELARRRSPCSDTVQGSLSKVGKHRRHLHVTSEFIGTRSTTLLLDPSCSAHDEDDNDVSSNNPLFLHFFWPILDLFDLFYLVKKIFERWKRILWIVVFKLAAICNRCKTDFHFGNFSIDFFFFFWSYYWRWGNMY